MIRPSYWLVSHIGLLRAIHLLNLFEESFLDNWAFQFLRGRQEILLLRRNWLEGSWTSGSWRPRKMTHKTQNDQVSKIEEDLQTTDASESHCWDSTCHCCLAEFTAAVTDCQSTPHTDLKSPYIDTKWSQPVEKNLWWVWTMNYEYCSIMVMISWTMSMIVYYVITFIYGVSWIICP